MAREATEKESLFAIWQGFLKYRAWYDVDVILSVMSATRVAVFKLLSQRQFLCLGKPLIMIPGGGDQGRLPTYQALPHEPDEIELPILEIPTNRESAPDPQAHDESQENNISQPRIPDSERGPSAPRQMSNSPTAETPELKEGSEMNDIKPHSIDWFGLEIAGVTIAAALLVGMIVLLGIYNKQPQPNWPHVSLNAVVAAISTLSKASLLFSVGEVLGQLKWVWFTQQERSLLDLRRFDAASRGVWGSLRLVWALRARHFASVGALAMILALGFEFFSQNLVQTVSKTIDDPSRTARIGNISVYNTIGPIGPYSGSFLVDSVLKANVYTSLFVDDQARSWAIPQYSCATGNCIWDPIVSLEIRSLCTNVTSLLIKTHHTNPNNSRPYPGAMNYTVSLPKPRLEPMTETSLSYTSDAEYKVPFTLNGNAQALVYNDRHIPVIQYIARQGPFLADFKEPVDWRASECVLEPIVRSSRVRIEQNNYIDETIAIWSKQDFKSLDFTKTNMTAGLYLTPSVDWWKDESGLAAYSENGTAKSFVLGQLALAAIDQFIPAIFSGSASWGLNRLYFTPDELYAGMYAGSDVLQALALGNITGCSDDTSERLSCALQNVAAAISKSFRDSAYMANPATAAMASGRVQINVDFVTVRWRWLALPLLVWALGATLVFGALWKSRRARVPPWRNDTLPLLYLYRGDERQREIEGSWLLQAGSGDGGADAGRASEPGLARLYEENGQVRLGPRVDGIAQDDASLAPSIRSLGSATRRRQHSQRITL
ncbi:hypothetical protein BP00DRAFT_493021 [Aspergillus indologenus CBS 114.80]|uniref:Uncharacterized protein n=1 Tax=Aspergillus indologenus CBS 114.80 TaxID=1450541 RepID=A0A2V5IZF5_9EURO|nr:hypothetical protein BP00DRAFT_493021 [Aspergillus indologenus CBS 114.80]